ncbi:hypothetical protein CBR_g50454 [Chara braunii]|uniref:DUF659 domain-containing protein n=1 Tax=Chara braunii TaxID=69332 RepID=A0A388M6W8_CHABU|nr:hypothetical protein CBR_g50454 [Chara braunii]|eukprot:GBG90276.1 hypothetical protein CBR_g50454 [Chara braunii]
MERVAWYEAEQGLDVPCTGGGEAGRQPLEGASGGVGGDGGGGDTKEGAIDVDCEARVPGEQGVLGHMDVPEVYPGTRERMEDFFRRATKGPVGEGSSKRKKGGTDPAAAPAGKRLCQQKVTDVYSGEWVARHKKAFLRWLYSSGVPFNAFRNQAWKAYQQVLLEQPGSSPRVVLPSHSEIASMQAVETHREELAEELEEVRQPFWITGATLLSDGRKSRDGRPIVNFLAASSRGVVVYTTINRDGEPDDAVHVLRRWARTQHMLEPAHCAGFLLNPRRRHVEYFSGEVRDYPRWLVRQAKRYILTQTGFEEDGMEYIIACRQFEDFHMQQGTFGDWGGGEGRTRGRACSGDRETIECASRWSQYGSGAPELQRCALRVIHMWSCASPAERNWAVHEGIHTKKRNQLAFEKVVQLVEITANVRLSEYRRAGTEREMMGGEEELWGPFGEVASTGVTGARATSPDPTRRESSVPPPSAPSPALPSPVSPYEPTTAAEDTEELASSLPQRGLLHRGGAVRQLRLRSPSPGVLQEEGGPSAAAVEGEIAVEGGLVDTTIAGLVDQIAVAAAASLLEELAASAGAAGGAAGGATGGAAAQDGLVAAAVGAVGGADAVEGGVLGAMGEIGAEAEVSRGGGDERLMQQFLTEQYDPSQPVPVAVHGVPPPVITDLGSEPVVAPPRLPSHFAPQEVRRPLDADELAREAVRDVTRLDRWIFDQRLQHPAWQAIPPVPWGPASPVWSGSTSIGARTGEDVPGVSGGVVETAPRTRDMPPPPPRPPVGDPSSSPTGRGSRSPHTPGRARIRDTTADVGDVSDTALFGRTHIDLDSTRRVTEHTARLQPNSGRRGGRMTAAREVGASGCEPQRGRDRGVSADSLEYALRAATRAVLEQTPRKRRVPPRPRPVPAQGGDALEETSRAEGLGMPRGSRREQTVEEATARVVVLRKAGAPVTIEEDDPETDVAVREDEDYEGEEEGEEESERGSDGDYDDAQHEPPPLPPMRAARRRAAQTSSSARGRRSSTSGTRRGTRRQSGKGKKCH